MVRHKTIRSIKDLRQDDKNCNLGTKRGAGLLEESLRRYGAGRSILADRTGAIIAGNKTLEGAAGIGLRDVVVVQTDGKKLVVVQRTDLDLASDPKARELAIADNRVGEVNLEWDEKALAELSADGLDLDLFWREAELKKLDLADNLAEAPEPQLDKATELQKKWKTARGQIWEIGPHRLMCGDSTNGEDLMALMGKDRASLCFTDPPWNVSIGGDNNPRHRQRQGLQNDSMSQGSFADFLSATADVLERYVAGDIYCVMGCEQWPALDAAFRNADLHWSATIIWVKDIFVLGRSKYHRRYEPIWYGWPNRGKSSYCGGRDQDDVWQFNRPRVSEEHPTMKPVGLVAQAIRNSSAPGGLVFDPFAGAGSTLAAATLLGRVGRCGEIDPRFVAVSLERMADMGLKPKLLGVRKGMPAA